MRSEFRRSFVKDLKNVSDKFLLEKVSEKILEIEQAKTLNDLAKLKKLKGGNNYFRLKIGHYRLGFVLEDETIIFVRFLHRKDIYKVFP